MKYLCIQCVLGIVAFASGTWGHQIDSKDGVGRAEYVQRKWITQLMDEAKGDFQFDSGVNEKCQRDFQLYQMHLQNQSIWAVRMLESSEWPSVGVYSGTTYSMGNWDECLRVAQYDIKGQYCLVEATFDWTENNKTDNQFTWPDERASIWNALKKYKTMPWLTHRQNLHWALCIPASCQPTEVASCLNKTLYPIFEEEGMSIQVKVEPGLCSQRNESYNFSEGFYIFCGFAVLLVLGVIFATFWHQEVQGWKDQEPNQVSTNSPSLIESFSIFHNMKSLLKKSSESNYIHSWRLIYMLLCIFGHRVLLTVGYPKFNFEKKELSSLRKDNFGVPLRLLFLVDIFCIISGFFTYHYGSLRKKPFGLMYVILIIIKRWIRMVPIFAIVILFVIHVFPHLSDGPFWNYRVYDEVESCKASFWYLIFGVNNVFETNKLCLLTSWYVSVDLQTAIIGDILLYLISRKKSLGVFATVALFLSSTIACSIILYVNEYHTFLQVNDRYLSKSREWEEFTNFYIKTYNRLPMYLLGFMFAYLMHNTRLRDYKVTNKIIFVWIIFLVLMKSSVMLYVEQFFDFVEPYDRLKHALNVLAPRFVFFIPDCCFLILCFKSTGREFTAKYFNYHMYTVLGRLLYSFYVVHIVLMIFHAASSQMLVQTNDLSIVWIFGADMCYSLIAALLVHLFIEAPISNLEKIGFQRFLRKNNRDDSKKQPNAENDTKTTLEESIIANGKSMNLDRMS